LAFAAAFWIVGIVAASAWYRAFGIGPAEWVYRQFGGGNMPVMPDSATPLPTEPAATAPR
jgi:uncharacterized membrane protein YeiB